MVRCTARMILHDQRTLKEQGTLTLLGEELNEQGYEIGVATRRLQERVLDPALRNAVNQFHSHMSGVEASVVAVNDLGVEDSIKHLEGQLRTMTDHYVVLSDLIGTALRGELGWLPEEGQEG